MNGDLKLRLAEWADLSTVERAFFKYLLVELSHEAMLGVTADVDVQVHVQFEQIENGEDDSAYVIGDGENFEVVIDNRMPFGMMIDFLIHELAHVHSWERACEDEDHCDEFGKSYALLYRKYLDLYDMFWG